MERLEHEASSSWMLLRLLVACNGMCFLNCRVPWQQFREKIRIIPVHWETVRILERPNKRLLLIKRQKTTRKRPILCDIVHDSAKTTSTKRASTQAGIKSKYHSQPTLPVYPDSIEHFGGPELMSDQRYIHWGHLLPSPTHGLAVNAVKLASGFHGENTAHKVDLGLSDGVQNGVLRWNNTSRKNLDISSGLFTLKITAWRGRQVKKLYRTDIKAWKWLRQ